MAMFSAQVYQNPYLARGAGLAHAVVSVTCTGAAGSPRPLAMAFLIDCSGSMEGEKVRNAQEALRSAIDLLPADATFCIICGTGTASLTFPLAPATPEQRA